LIYYYRLGRNTMENNKIIYSKKDKLTEDEFEKKNTKVRITTFIDIDIVEKLKEAAAVSGKKYQTLLNEKLREIVLEEETIKSTLSDINKRLTKVEKRIKAG
jgi:uncharacterized protein (DUF4415 family)